MPILRALLALLLCAAPALADLSPVALAEGDDWLQWLGPARSGVSTEKIAPWKEPPKVLWKHAEIGRAHV